VELRISIVGDDVEARVTDDGKGMPPPAMARAKELFYRGSDAPPLDGHGIGLALVDRIMQVLDGRFEIDSVEGKGTVAIVRLPMAL
jgi:two-component system OmpR family sensor kinase